MERGLETAGKRKTNKKKSARRQQGKNSLLRGRQVQRGPHVPAWQATPDCGADGCAVLAVAGALRAARASGWRAAGLHCFVNKRSKCQGQTAPARGTLPVALTESAAGFATSPFGKVLGKGQDQQTRPWPAPCPHPGLPQRGKEQDSPARSARKRLGNQPRTTASASLRHHSSAA